MEVEKKVKIREKRICIYAKDIQILTGKSERYARKVISQVRQFYSKDRNQLITIKEFCGFMNLDEQEVKDSLLN